MIINPKEENKSNDSLQDALKVVLDYFDKDTTNVPMEVYKKVFNTLYPPKPQADNKPDWEIVAFIGNGGMIYQKTDQNIDAFTCFENFGHKKYIEADFLNNSSYKIHSVKRSDGEVFSVGDEVMPDSPAVSGWDRRPVHKIKYFSINDDKSVSICCHSDIPVCGNNYDSDAYKSGHFSINQIQKYSAPQPQKLFTTEDGVLLQSGDIGREIFFITNHWEAKYWRVTEDFKPLEGVKYFYRKEAAEKYISENKPLTLSCQTTNKNNPK